MIYLNYNSTAMLSEMAKREMYAHCEAGEGNPAEEFLPQGRKARESIDKARQQVADLLGSDVDEVVFTSGGSEGCFLAIAGALAATGLKRILISAIEHPAVLQAAHWLRDAMGVKVEVLPLSQDTGIDWQQWKQQLSIAPALVSVMSANNETGDTLPLLQLAELTKRHRCVLHSDAVQLAGKQQFDFSSSGIDLLSISSHKISGPRGVGALIIKKKTPFKSPLVAGGQEEGRRGGTPAVAAIVGFGAAALEAKQQCRDSLARVEHCRELFEKAVLAAYPEAAVNRIAPFNRLANTSNIFLPGTVSFRLVEALANQGLYISAGSACSSAQLQPSKTLLALGMTTLRALSSIRVSFGFGSTETEAIQAAEMITSEAKRQRSEAQIELQRIQAKD